MKDIFRSEQSLFRDVAKEKHKKLSSTFFILIMPVIVLVIGGFGAAIFIRRMGLFYLKDWFDPAFYLPIELMIGTGFAIVLVFLIVKFKEKRKISTLGLSITTYSLGQYLRGFVLGIMMFGSSLAIIVLSTDGEVSFQGISLRSMLPFLFMLLAWVIQGASEEILLRGYMLPALAVRKGAKFAIITSSVYFAALHLGNSGISFIGFMNIILVGIFTTLYAIYEDSIWGVCGWHSAWNFAQGNLFGCLVSGIELGGSSLFITYLPEESELITGGNFGPEASIIVTIIFLGAAYSLYRLLRNAAFISSH
ncbi:CPBP family intramembrane glutamic endopeptidase [Cellulosilyticum sp. I15G10I2]|uniref:CPBP family intramembrane glutamic endopeptidase n=1 Tax=Cellulosilyticum sp. I15G10I2 TaxID=1892843 RepID=UPI00085CBE0A|nr:type II CAAX endopeptidase family protein [Cellulosilyticum sp. I15G10I2]